MSNITKKFKCSFCNKSYSTYESRCNHIKLYHQDIKTNFNNGNNTCLYCDKKYINLTSKANHENKCKQKKESNKYEISNVDCIIILLSKNEML